jgi:serine/threonine protein kinase
MLSQIKHYRILHEIGGGGFAKVYVAQDENLKREVAIKVLHANLAEDNDFRRFFEREAQLVAALEHLAVVPIYDYGEINGQLYLVMRLMRGGTLADRLEKSKKALTLAEVIRLLERLAPTLDAIHAKGVIHRDLKPSNILYDEAGSAYIADFGIARVQQATTRLTQTGLSFGTPQYSSPEQITGEGTLDHRSDIYTLGVILYELLTGEYPYWSDTPLGWVYKHLEAPIPNVRDINHKLPEGVQAVLEGMLAKAREDRYDSVEAVLADLKRAESGQSVLFQGKRSKKPGRTVPIARPNRPQPERAIPIPQNRSTLMMAAVAIGAVVLILGWVFLQNSGGGGDAETAGAPTPTTTIAEEVAVVPPNVTSAPPTATTAPTATEAQATVPAVAATSTSLLDATATISATATTTPTATATVTPLPTSTPIVVETATTAPTEIVVTVVIPTATRTPAPIPTRDLPIAAPPTATVAATQAVLILPITLVEPANDASFSAGELITFRWQGGGTLQAGQYYDVRVWREGAPHYGVVGSQTTQATINANSLGTGTFFWSVAVVSNGGATTVVGEAPARSFTISGGGGGTYENGGNNGGTPGQNPTVTPPPY